MPRWKQAGESQWKAGNRGGRWSKEGLDRRQDIKTQKTCWGEPTQAEQPAVGLWEAKGTALFQGGPSYGPAEGQQGSRTYLAKEDANLVPVGVASQRSDVPHIRDQLGQVLAAAVHFCFPMWDRRRKNDLSIRQRSLPGTFLLITEINLSECSDLAYEFCSAHCFSPGTMNP